VRLLDRALNFVPRRWRVTLDWLVTLAFAVAVVFITKVEVANAYVIPSASMEPTLHCARGGDDCRGGRFSDRVLANRFVYRLRDPKRREVVVFRVPRTSRCGREGETFVKRIIALPGDTWEERDGVVYVNGRMLREPYVAAWARDGETNGRRVIPDGQYFVQGDNRVNSCDSRVFGAVPRGNFIGPVFAIYWPPARVHASP
jgi:signal peptidase I